MRPTRGALASFFAALVTATLSACATTGQGDRAAWPAMGDEALFRLTVANHHTEPVEVFVVSGDRGLRRIGAVRPNFAQSFRVARAPYSMRLFVRPLGGVRESFTTVPFAVRDGGDVRLLVRGILGHHTLRVF